MTALAGNVYLVGAGPGDPGLITARGLDLLRSAAVVVHDRLIGPELLDEARPDALLVAVGKAPGRHLATQERINELLVEHALEGRSVVRLKGGDPFLYGRGWEELEACRVRGVPCEVVPGVTSALAAPAVAGIPVTTRGVAASVAVVTPRAGGSRAARGLDFAALARVETVCVLMGRAELDAVAAGLVAAGRDPGTPVAAIERGTMAGQRTVRATLGTIARAADEAGLESPVVVVVGAVAALGMRGSGPLHRRRIVVTRPREAARPIVARLRELGADVVEVPLIRIAYLDPPADAVRLDDYRWIVFTSRHGVIGFARWLRAAGRDARALAGARVAVVGPATGAALRELGIVPEITAAPHRATALARALLAERQRWPGRVLLPCGTRAGELLEAALAPHGVGVDLLRVYDTLSRRPEGRARDLVDGADAALLHSPSAAQSWVEADLPRTAALFACIGDTTGDAARALGLAPVAVSADHTDEGLVRLLLDQVSCPDVRARTEVTT